MKQATNTRRGGSVGEGGEMMNWSGSWASNWASALTVAQTEAWAQELSTGWAGSSKSAIILSPHSLAYSRLKPRAHNALPMYFAVRTLYRLCLSHTTAVSMAKCGQLCSITVSSQRLQNSSRVHKPNQLHMASRGAFAAARRAAE